MSVIEHQHKDSGSGGTEMKLVEQHCRQTYKRACPECGSWNLKPQTPIDIELDVPQEYGGAAGSTFQHLRLHNPIVAHIMRTGGTAEDCAVALATHNDRLVDRLTTLESIAPRRIKLPDGRVVIWRCPEHLVPETDMSNARDEGLTPHNQSTKAK